MEQNMITIRNLSKEFKGQSVLKNITMEIPKNCVYGLLGASPRAAQALIRTARARAFMENRLNVSFEDVKCVALPVLRHRILLSFDAVSEGITEDAVIGQILTEKEQGLYA